MIEKKRSFLEVPMGKYGTTSTLMVPDKVVYGTNTIEGLGDYALSYGKRAALLYGGGSLLASGNHERITKVLREKGIEIIERGGIIHDPDEALVKSVVEKIKSGRPDVIIGVGGGSVIDVAKAVSILATNGGEVSDYWQGKLFSEPSIPYIAVPTTAGTGSEVTKNAVITNRDHTFKKSIRSEYMIPNMALVDPCLTLGSPPDITINTGLDALIQNIEAYTSKNAGPITDTLARKGIELAGTYLIRAVKQPDELEAREGLALASLYSGISLFNAGLGLAHGLSHPIGILFHVPHGRACAAVMPKVMEYNQPGCEQKYAEVGMLLAGIPNGPAAFRSLLEELGVSCRLGEYGIGQEDIPRIVAESKGGSRNYNPLDHSDETVQRMLEEML